MTERLDKFLYKNNLAKTRTEAQRMIARKEVLVNETITEDFDKKVSNEDKITIKKASVNYISRGGEKLEEIIKTWKINFKSKNVLDIGSSTGGFTERALNYGANKIYAVDVGKEQLDKSLKGNPKIISMEGTDIRSVKKTDLQDEIDIVLADVSFISLSHILPKVFELLKNESEAVVLVKPQFEIGPNKTKKGVVKDDEETEKILKRIETESKSLGFQFFGFLKSPIKGKTGNQEFFMYLKKK